MQPLSGTVWFTSDPGLAIQFNADNLELGIRGTVSAKVTVVSVVVQRVDEEVCPLQVRQPKA